jgi:hypothetical protein
MDIEGPCAACCFRGPLSSRRQTAAGIGAPRNAFATAWPSALRRQVTASNGLASTGQLRAGPPAPTVGGQFHIQNRVGCQRGRLQAEFRAGACVSTRASAAAPKTDRGHPRVWQTLVAPFSCLTSSTSRATASASVALCHLGARAPSPVGARAPSPAPRPGGRRPWRSRRCDAAGRLAARKRRQAGTATRPRSFQMTVIGFSSMDGLPTTNMPSGAQQSPESLQASETRERNRLHPPHVGAPDVLLRDHGDPRSGIHAERRCMAWPRGR